MRFGKTLLAAASALTVAGAPVVAQAAPSVNKQQTAQVKRAGASNKAESKLGGGSGVIIAVAAAAAIILGIVLLSDDDEPTSP
jgi:NAD/NADP transhydrogenase alpha subunit